MTIDYYPKEAIDGDLPGFKQSVPEIETDELGLPSMEGERRD